MPPNFEASILCAPYGFSNGCQRLNEISLIDEDALKKVLYEGFTLSNGISEKSVQREALKAINYIYRAYKQASSLPSAQEIVAVLDNYTILSRDCMEYVIHTMINFHSEITLESAAKKLKFCKLTNFNWKIGLAIASKSCNQLNRPYVNIQFNLTTANGDVSTHSAELTVDQFKVT
mmetsp:Transcript_1749/g.2802  ORF Transcript_1749/g.2802 Transcript_1749/m.2802 type:complete len:176 (+) Transcript_1749:378-905(+)